MNWSATPPTEQASGSTLHVVLERAKERGALGPAPVAEHVEHARGFVLLLDDLLQPGDRVLDLGSGGGIPGLVVAETARYDVTLLEGRSARARSLAETVEELGWPVRILARRAEEAGQDPTERGRYQAVTARGFGPPAVTAECAAPFLAPAGFLIVSEPPQPAPARWPANGLAALGLAVVREVRAPHGFVILQLVAECPTRYPRRVGIPSKRPLF